MLRMLLRAAMETRILWLVVHTASGQVSSKLCPVTLTVSEQIFSELGPAMETVSGRPLGGWLHAAPPPPAHTCALHKERLQ